MRPSESDGFRALPNAADEGQGGVRSAAEITAGRFSRIKAFLPVQRGNVSLTNLQVLSAVPHVTSRTKAARGARSLLNMDRTYEDTATRQSALNPGFSALLAPLALRAEPSMVPIARYRRHTAVERLLRCVKAFRRIFSQGGKRDGCSWFPCVSRSSSKHSVGVSGPSCTMPLPLGSAAPVATRSSGSAGSPGAGEASSTTCPRDAHLALLTQSLNSKSHHIACFQESWRLVPHAHARWRSSCNHVAW